MKISLKAMAGLLALAILVALSVGCHPPRKVMFKQEFIQGKSVRHIRNPVTAEYNLQICEFDDSGERQSCTESTILDKKDTETLL